MARVVLSSLGVVFLILCHTFILPSSRAVAQLPYFQSKDCFNDKGNYTENSTYQFNLNNLLSILPSQDGNGRGFYSLSYGNSSDRVNSIGLCRGDLTADVCRSCLNNATQRLRLECPNQKETVGWYDYCMLRYSNRSMIGTMETAPSFFVYVVQNVSSVDEFTEDLRTLFDRLKSQAASGNSLRKYAAGSASAPDFQTLYALAQCTPDLSLQDCNNCLDSAFGSIRQLGHTKIAVKVANPNCYFRYETSLFYEPTADEPTAEEPVGSSPPPLGPILNPSATPSNNGTSTSEGGESNRSRIVIIAVVSSTLAFVVVLVISVCVFLRIKEAKQREESHSYEPVEESKSAESLQYNFETVRVATDNFSESNKLGQGGFGSVYRGRLSSGKDIAVKRLSRGSSQGDLEFKNEVLLVAKLQHRNLVRLLGFCLKGNERLLVYEFVQSGSLDNFIFVPSKRENLDWVRRYKIIGGVARGLLYLHEDSRLRIIHRDLKASNILLDDEMNPKIADFGMARLFVVDQTQGNTRRIVGTYGYMAPEYVIRGKFSVKSDVFSFGVLVLEIVSGQKNNSFRHGEHVEGLLSYAWRSWRDGTASNIVDPLVRVGAGSDIMRYIHIGLLCVQQDMARRPTMSAVVLMLNSNSLSLPVPSEPAFFNRSNSGSDSISKVAESDHSNSQSIQASANEASFTELYPR